MKRKYYFVILFLVLAIFLSGCSGIITPDPNEVGGDFYICENLLKGYYTALSNRNYTQALSYCKPGGVMFKFANSMWDLALDYPEFYHTYQIYNVYNFSHPTSYYVNAEYDFSATQHDIYGGTYGTDYYYGFAAPFEKVNGEWKIS
jgi:hypothetical protein